MRKILKSLVILFSLHFFSSHASPPDTHSGQSIRIVSIPTGGHTAAAITGIEVRLLDNAFEQRHRNNFQNGLMVRMITDKTFYLMRVHTDTSTITDPKIKELATLGTDGTYLTASFFTNAAEARQSLALLEEWYRHRGGIAQYSIIEVPKGTEIYIGSASPQRSTETLKRNPGKKIRDSKPQEIVLGGGVQILVPPVNMLGKPQLSAHNVIETNNIKKK